VGVKVCQDGSRTRLPTSLHRSPSHPPPLQPHAGVHSGPGGHSHHHHHRWSFEGPAVERRNPLIQWVLWLFSLSLLSGRRPGSSSGGVTRCRYAAAAITIGSPSSTRIVLKVDHRPGQAESRRPCPDGWVTVVSRQARRDHRRRLDSRRPVPAESPWPLFQLLLPASPSRRVAGQAPLLPLPCPRTSVLLLSPLASSARPCPSPASAVGLAANCFGGRPVQETASARAI